MPVKILVKCPYCNTTEISKNGSTPQGKQRYRCYNPKCTRRSFIIDYTNIGYLPKIKEKIVSMSMNGSGVRDTSRVLSVSLGLVINELKKKSGQYKKSKSKKTHKQIK